jgi:hypothetical protein
VAGRQAVARLGLGAGGTSTPAGPTVLLEVITRVAGLDGPPIALIVDFASRLVVRPDAVSEGERCVSFLSLKRSRLGLGI